VRKHYQKSNFQTWDFKPKLKNEAIVLHSILDIYSISTYEVIVNDIRKLITSLIRNHGFTDGPKRYNVIKQYTIDLIELRNPVNPGWVSTSERWNVPSKLGISMIQLIVDYFNCNDDPTLRAKYYQVINTILNISRIVDGLVDADFKSVTDKAVPINEELLAEFTTYVETKLEPFQYKIQKVNLSSYKINYMKRGPSGKPKLESALEEAVLLLSDKSLHKPFKCLCTEVGVDYLYSYLSALTAQVSATQSESIESPNAQTCLRKLVTIPDTGMKTRIVAIVDFWTQLVLEPVRDHVQMVIQKLYKDTDFRMDQNQGVNSMVEFQKRCLAKNKIGQHELDIQSLKFYDISSWTDRFHRDLQKVVMVKLFSPRLAQAWSQLTVHCAWQVKDTNRTVKYGQGQGMGTNGSFDIATLTDHLFINFLYEKKCSIPDINKWNAYGKVGDDLWIYDPEGLIPIYYEKINLPINMSKSKEFCKLGSVAEFCSRTFINGLEASRISPRIISKSTDFRYLPLLLSYCASREVQLNRSSFPILDLKVKDGEELYFDKLQPWILSTFVASSHNFSNLTLEYLEAGNWISDHTRSIITDQATIVKIQTGRALTQLVRFNDDIEMKTSETIEAEGNLSMDEIFLLSQGQHDLFDPKNPTGAFALKWFKSDNEVLTPRQIFILTRYITQNRLVTDKFYEIYSLDPTDSNYLLNVKDILEEISERSVYDRGNINYNPTGYVSAQYEIVKTLSRFDDTFVTLNLSASEAEGISRLIGEPVLQSRIVEELLTIRIVEPQALTSL